MNVNVTLANLAAEMLGQFPTKKRRTLRFSGLHSVDSITRRIQTAVNQSTAGDVDTVIDLLDTICPHWVGIGVRGGGSLRTYACMCLRENSYYLVYGSHVPGGLRAADRWGVLPVASSLREAVCAFPTFRTTSFTNEAYVDLTRVSRFGMGHTDLDFPLCSVVLQFMDCHPNARKKAPTRRTAKEMGEYLLAVATVNHATTLAVAGGHPLCIELYPGDVAGEKDIRLPSVDLVRKAFGKWVDSVEIRGCSPLGGMDCCMEDF